MEVIISQREDDINLKRKFDLKKSLNSIKVKKVFQFCMMHPDET